MEEEENSHGSSEATPILDRATDPYGTADEEGVGGLVVAAIAAPEEGREERDRSGGEEEKKEGAGLSSLLLPSAKPPRPAGRQHRRVPSHEPYGIDEEEGKEKEKEEEEEEGKEKEEKEDVKNTTDKEGEEGKEETLTPKKGNDAFEGVGSVPFFCSSFGNVKMVSSTSLSGDTSDHNVSASTPTHTSGGRARAASGGLVFTEVFEVGVNIYDFSNGFVKKHSMALFGQEVEGMLYSSIVVYGFEYYFERGIARAPRDHTKFGPPSKYVVVATHSTVRQPVFEAWLRGREKDSYLLQHYHLTDHNCHHFVDEACRFLCGEPAPALLLENTKLFVECPIGRCLLPVAARVIGGLQQIDAHCSTQHEAQRRKAARRTAIALNKLKQQRESRWEEEEEGNVSPRPLADTITTITKRRSINGDGNGATVVAPVKAVFVFRPQDPAQATAAVMGLLLCHSEPEDLICFSPMQTATVEKAARIVSARDTNGGLSSLTEYEIKILVPVLVELAAAKESWALGPVLDAWRVLSLDENFVAVAAFDVQLNVVLIRVAQDFHSIPVTAQIAFLRLLCNVCGHAYGAAVLVDCRRLARWTRVIADGMSSPHRGVKLLAASLVNNIAHSLVILTKGSFEEKVHDDHPVVNLLSLILFHLQEEREEEEGDGIVLRLLMALHRLVAQGGYLVELVWQRTKPRPPSRAAPRATSSEVNDFLPMPLDWEKIEGRCRSEESRALAFVVQCLLKEKR